MSSSQTVSSKGKNIASPACNKASWDTKAKECYIKVCVEEMLAPGHQPGAPIGRGWENIRTKYNAAMGKDLTKTQLKNQWFVLKKEWQLWQHLVLGESGLGRDPVTGAIEASEDWWDNKIMVQPDCKRFRHTPLPMEEEMRILFSGNTATGEHEYAPSQIDTPVVRIQPSQTTVDVDDIDELLENNDEVQELVHPTKVPKKRQIKSPSGSKKVKGKKGTVTSRLEGMLQQICDSNDSATSVQRPIDNIPTIKECSDKLNELPQFNGDSDSWAQAFSLFSQAKNRAMFMACPDDDKKYYFIMQELKKERVSQLGNTWFSPAS